MCQVYCSYSSLDSGCPCSQIALLGLTSPNEIIRATKAKQNLGKTSAKQTHACARYTRNILGKRIILGSLSDARLVSKTRNPQLN